MVVKEREREREKIEEVGDVDVVQGTRCGMTLKWGSLVGRKPVTYSTSTNVTVL